MRVRDAVEADAESMAALVESPLDVMRNIVHDRTVRVAVETGADTPEEEELRGFVSYDVRDRTVHVTQLAGGENVCDRLLEEPIRFARREGMGVELLVPEGESAVRTAAKGKSFREVEQGPTFAGAPTVRYRLDPDE